MTSPPGSIRSCRRICASIRSRSVHSGHVPRIGSGSCSTSPTEFGQRSARRLHEEIIGWLTTVTPERAAQPIPVWFLWDGDRSIRLYSTAWTSASSANIEREPDASASSLDSDGARGATSSVVWGELRVCRRPAGRPGPRVRREVPRAGSRRCAGPTLRATWAARRLRIHGGQPTRSARSPFTSRPPVEAPPRRRQRRTTGPPCSQKISERYVIVRRMPTPRRRGSRARSRGGRTGTRAAPRRAAAGTGRACRAARSRGRAPRDRPRPAGAVPPPASRRTPPP